MSQMNAGMSYSKGTQSIAFKFFSESIKQLEKEISNNSDSNLFTDEQVDFIDLICAQFQKLVKLRHKSKYIDGLLSHYFPELFKLSSQNNAQNHVNSANEPVDQWKGNKFTFSCDVCDEEIPIVNHDLNYSTQLHFNSPYHLEVVSVLRRIKESEISTNLNGNSTTNLTTNFRAKTNVHQNSFSGSEMKAEVPTASESTVSNLQTLEQSKPSVSASSSISKEEESFQRFKRIKDLNQSNYLVWRDSEYYCCLCDASLPTQHNFDHHISGFCHRNNLKLARTSSTIRNCNISSNDQNSEIILTENGRRFCELCNVLAPSEHNFLVHMNSVSHKNKVAKRAVTNSNTAVNSINNALPNGGRNSSSDTSVCTSSNAIKNQTAGTSNDDVIVRHNGVLYCTLCNVLLTRSQVYSHTNGSRHKKELMNFDLTHNFIIYKKGKRYCSLCDAQLSGDSQFNSHINGSKHKSNVLTQQNLK